MTYDDLNKYIIHYLEHDRTHSAIMLSGPWGSGKSHYIKHNLIPALKKSNGEKDRSIVVSLYGFQEKQGIQKCFKRGKVLSKQSSEGCPDS